MTTSMLRQNTASALITRLIESPELVRAVRALPSQAFSMLVKHIGVEDAGEFVALATTEQLVAAFDEDLFHNDAPGERERFDRKRFVVWLEVLLEAGDDVAASRVCELSQDFVVLALSSILLVLDQEALFMRMREYGQDTYYVDKAIESSLSEELDGYLLIAKAGDEGWDAALSLILALDRSHRSVLEGVLDRCADIASQYIDDLDALATVLTTEESLAEDVEAEREDRRSQKGFVEPRAARSFLSLARKADDASERDPVTRAYFREFERPSPSADALPADERESALDLARLLQTMEDAGVRQPLLLSGADESDDEGHEESPLVAAMGLLNDIDSQAFAARMEEFGYLVNVLMAGAHKDGERFRLADAAEAVLTTVEFGAELLARRQADRPTGRALATELRDILRTWHTDQLFRMATQALVARDSSNAGFLRSRDDLAEMLEDGP